VYYYHNNYRHTDTGSLTTASNPFHTAEVRLIFEHASQSGAIYYRLVHRLCPSHRPSWVGSENMHYVMGRVQLSSSSGGLISV